MLSQCKQKRSNRYKFQTSVGHFRPKEISILFAAVSHRELNDRRQRLWFRCSNFPSLPSLFFAQIILFYIFGLLKWFVIVQNIDIDHSTFVDA